MPQDNTYGTYHLADNPALYDPMRNNTFEFVVTGLDKLLRVGADGSEENAYITNAQEVLRLSVDSASIPMFTQEFRLSVVTRQSSLLVRLHLLLVQLLSMTGSVQIVSQL